MMTKDEKERIENYKSLLIETVKRLKEMQQVLNGIIATYIDAIGEAESKIKLDN